MRAVILSVLLFAAPLWAGPLLTLPKEVKGEPGAFLRVVAETPGKVVKWRPVDAGLNLFPVDLLKDTKVAVVVALKPGRYRLQAVTALADEPSDIVETTVIVGDAPDPGPDPGPGPQPKPEPDAELYKKLKPLYDGEASADKKKHSKALASVYRQGLSQVDSFNTGPDAMQKLQTVSKALLPATALKPMRDAIAVELSRLVPRTDDPLTSDQKKAIKEAFDKLARTLEVLSNG